MSTPAPARPPRKGPSPVLLGGLALLGSVTFFLLAQSRHNDPRQKRKDYPSPLLPSRDGEKVEVASMKGQASE